MKILVSTETTTDLKGRELIAAVIDPEIARFESWFRNPQHGNSGLTPLERELFRSYLYQKLTGVL